MRISDWSSDVCSSDLVLDDAGHPEVALASHRDGSAGHLLGAERGGGDHQHLGAGQQLGHAHLHVAGAGGHVDEEVVEVVAPHDVLEEVGDAAVQHEAAPHERRLLVRSEEHTSELQSLMRISYAVFCLKKKKPNT